MTTSAIRARILDVTARNGGHLASSLGAVELAAALCKTFDPMRDRIVWDVGHQAYAWKMLTGREERFDTLRRFGGVAPFPLPAESRADAAVAGHAGVALSLCEGMAFARDVRAGDCHVVAVVGDAALANGTALEAIADPRAAASKVILVVNDNSAGNPDGGAALAQELARHAAGMRRIGPVDGHDIDALTAALAEAKEEKRSVIVHVITTKGKGWAPAEADPAAWHGVAPRGGAHGGTTWSEAMGCALCEMAARDGRIAALTAAMPGGTGLGEFARLFPKRFRDVGIAEGHMVACAAGMAAGGMRPFVAVYSTFLQRAIDQVMHDVAIAALPVVLCVDRAGAVGADGVTHQGLYDYAMLKCVPGLTICQPSDMDDLRSLMAEALERNGPTAIRYPRGVAPERAKARTDESARIAIWATGDMVPRANAVAERVGATVVHARYLKPFDRPLLAAQRAAGMKIVSLENGCVTGGFGETIGADVRFGWPDEFIPHGSIGELERAYSLDADAIARRILAG